MSESPAKRLAIGKADPRYWLQAGKLLADPRSRFLTCKVQVAGRRESFPLRTSNKATAAAKAAQVFGDVVALGWDTALAKHKPATERPVRSATVGGWIETVRTTADFRPATLATYTQCLRQIVSEIVGIGDEVALDANGNEKRDRKRRVTYRSRFDYRAGGRDAWCAKVDGQPLSILTPEAVQRWRIAYVTQAGTAPAAKRHAESSAASIIRNARSLFSAKAREFADKAVTLPDPLPFANVKLGKRISTSYQSKIDAASLIAAARTELNGEPFKIFCLGLLCGLRKKEIDALAWTQIDFQSGEIHIEHTAHFGPKSEDSIGAVDLDDELLALLRGWKVRATGEFVIESKDKPRYDRSRPNYRAQRSFKTLYAWLRGKGISAQKPLHELRKELGAILSSQDGIFAAQRVLRHAEISTTAAYYSDKKRRITAGLGAFLTDSVTVPFTSSAKDVAVPQTRKAKAKRAKDCNGPALKEERTSAH